MDPWHEDGVVVVANDAHRHLECAAVEGTDRADEHARVEARLARAAEQAALEDDDELCRGEGTLDELVRAIVEVAIERRELDDEALFEHLPDLFGALEGER